MLRMHFFMVLAHARQAHAARVEDLLWTDGSSLISTSCLISSYGELSSNRLQDTVYAEFPQLRKYIQRLVRKPKRFDSYAEVMEALGEDAIDRPIEEIVNDLVYAGIMFRHHNENVGIAWLYQAALRSAALQP
ncbi:MAG: hypothetical protein LC808_22820 [Actinobacteria bacterium]|nr:hypothetical protein [Actinomycetota bacterium]